MKIYIAWWDNGLEYEDHNIVLVGVFTNEKKARAAAEAYCKKMQHNNYFYRRSTACVEEAVLNKPIVNLLI